MWTFQALEASKITVRNFTKPPVKPLMASAIVHNGSIYTTEIGKWYIKGVNWERP